MSCARAIMAGRPRRGGILFEVVLAVALFGGAASITLAAVRSVYATLERLRLQQEAVDLAKSKLAELEAGLITVADLRGDSAAGPGSMEDQVRFAHEWRFDLKTHRTEFTGLTLVELTVRLNSPDQDEAFASACTLRQLMPLRAADAASVDQSQPPVVSPPAAERGL